MVVWKRIGRTTMRSLVQNPPELLHCLLFNYSFDIFLNVVVKGNRQTEHFSFYSTLLFPMNTPTSPWLGISPKRG